MWHKVGTNVGKALERRVSRAAGGVGRYVRKESRSEIGVGGGGAHSNAREFGVC
jgi:hypothetical protein